MTETSSGSRVRGLRRAAIITAIVSLSAAALLGIAMILTGDWADISWRVMSTTAVVGAFSILVLADLAIVDREVGGIGWTGAGVATVAAVLSVIAIWIDTGIPSWMLRIILVTAIVGVATAVASLLLLLARRRHSAVRVLLPIELVLIGISTLMLVLPAATDGDIPGYPADGYWRLFAVIMILAVLGAVVLPVVGLILKAGEPIAEGGPSPLSLDVPGDLADRLRAEAAATGRTVEDLALEALAERFR
ncbi:hypothetical protein [uncultured Microbacterium sp.]|uniref:hypothetical protein n=1 Tax=uncultured Microbacterium sp. TaxID=191216 RepID=UPI0026267F04|nr:hypothetical protein [uncultured Microbacterium sp.]